MIQQTLNYPTRYPCTPEAELPIAQYINGRGYGPLGRFQADGFDSELLSAPYISLFNLPGTNLNTTATKCTTGNCTWDSYESLGVCNSCVDLTPKLAMNEVEQPFDKRSDSCKFGLNLYTASYLYKSD